GRNGQGGVGSHRAPEAVGRPVLDATHPGGHDPPDAAGGDELVEAHVGDGADQTEVAPALPDELVGRGEGDQALERGPEADTGAVRDVALDRLGQGEELAHPFTLRWSSGAPPPPGAASGLRILRRPSASGVRRAPPAAPAPPTALTTRGEARSSARWLTGAGGRVALARSPSPPRAGAAASRGGQPSRP